MKPPPMSPERIPQPTLLLSFVSPGAEYRAALAINSSIISYNNQRRAGLLRLDGSQLTLPPYAVDRQLDTRVY